MSHADHADNRRQTTKPNKLQSVFLCGIIQLSCIPLRHLRYLRENIYIRLLKQFAQKKPKSLPQISQIYADKTPNSNNLKQPVFLCDIMQLSCIPLRNLRYLRENIYIRLLKQSAQKKPKSLPQISQIYADKPQNSLNLKQPVFLCGIIQLAVFLCVICEICGRITRKSTLSISTNENPMSPADLADDADKTQNGKTTITIKQT